MADASSARSERNDDPAHIAAVAKIAEHRCCDWTGQPCGRDIPEFGGRDVECVCETIAEICAERDAAVEMRLLERLERDGLLEGVLTAAFEIHLDEMGRCARPIMLHTVAVASDGITAREYADHERLKLSAASERLRQAWALGLLNRTPIDRNEYRYEAVRRCSSTA